ncbi:MAG: hypothetical protein K2W85_12045 [Phycisphaerales bacterium]|nr:hypothetical protein [Phycisphaerales bacterium]
MVFSVGGVFIGASTALQPLIMSFASSIAGDQPAFAVARKWMYVSMATGIVGGLIAIVLLVGAILLLRRNPTSIRVLSVWAVLKIIFALGSGVIATFMQLEQAQAIAGTPTGGAPMPISANAMTAISIFGILLSLLWAMAFPFVLLIWFRRQPVRAEIDRWRRNHVGIARP